MPALQALIPANMSPPPSDWPRALALLDEALALAEPQRQAWLDRTAASEPQVLPLLRKLLHAHERVQAHELLATLPKLPAQPLADRPPATGHKGQCVGPFELIEPLGQGGMGSVWLARYADGRLKREVAVKLPAASHNPSALNSLRERFARERDFLAQLEHPHIARLYDAGVSDAGQPFLAMEYVAGQPIDRWCDGQRLGIAQRLALFQQVLAAVAHAHQQLVLHRDLKPGNVLVDGQGQVRLLDFGIARLLPPTAPPGGVGDSGNDAVDAGAFPVTAPANLTEQIGAAFTLGHAAPEQLQQGALSTATDVYALGVMLYQLLTGLSPYQPSRDTRGALEDAVLLATPEAPSLRGLGPDALAARQTSAAALRHALRGDLDTITAKALKKNPAERYPTVAALAEDLGRHLARQPISARPDTWAYRARLFVARHRLAVAATALASVAIITTAGVAAWQAQASAANAAMASKEAARANAAQKFFAGLLSSADPEKNKHMTLASRQMVDEALVTAERELAASPETLALVLKQLSDVYMRLDVPEQYLKVQRRRVALLQGTAGGNTDDSVDAQIELARAMGTSAVDADRQQAMAAALQARDMALARQASPALVVTALCLVADLQAHASRYGEAYASATQAVAQALAARPVPQDALALAYAQLGKAASAEGRFDEARQAFHKTIEIDKGPNGRGLVEQIQTRILLANLEFASGQYEAAYRESMATLEAAKQNLGEMEGTLFPARTLAVSAGIAAGHAAKLWPQVPALLAPDLASTEPLRKSAALYAHGMAAMVLGQWAVAESSFAQAEPGAAVRPQLATRLRIRMAELKLRQGQPDQALAMLDTWAGAGRVSGQAPSEDAAMALERAGVALARLGRRDDAQRAFDDACTDKRMRLPDGHPTKVRCQAYRLLVGSPPGQLDALSRLLGSLQGGQYGRTALANSLCCSALMWARSQLTSEPQLSKFPLLD